MRRQKGITPAHPHCLSFRARVQIQPPKSGLSYTSPNMSRGEGITGITKPTLQILAGRLAPSPKFSQPHTNWCLFPLSASPFGQLRLRSLKPTKHNLAPDRTSPFPRSARGGPPQILRPWRWMRCGRPESTGGTKRVLGEGHHLAVVVKTNGNPFRLVGAPPILEPIVVGIGMFTGVRAVDP